MKKGEATQRTWALWKKMVKEKETGRGGNRRRPARK